MTTDVEHEDEGRDPGEVLSSLLAPLGDPELSKLQERALNEALYTAQERRLFPELEGVTSEDALYLYKLVSWALTSPSNEIIDSMRM